MRVLLALDPDEAGQKATLAHIEAIADFGTSWGVPRGTGPTAQALATAQNARDDAAQRRNVLMDALAASYDENGRNPNQTLLAAAREADVVLETIGLLITDLYPSLFKDRDYERCESAEEWQEFMRPKPPAPYQAGRVDFEAIKRRVDLADWLTQVTGIELVMRGNTLKGPCPLPTHEDDTPSFFIYPDQQRYYCFGCHKWGDIFDIAKELGINVKDL